MARAKLDPQIVAHLEWIGFIQPTGLVVSAPALVRAGAILDRRDAEGQRLLRESAEEREFDPKAGPEPWLPDFQAFATSVLGWSFSAKGYAGTPESPIPPELEVTLVDYGETLRPDIAVREMEPRDGDPPWQLLVKVLGPGQDFDSVIVGKGQLEASPHGRMDRLLRRTGISAGLLFNGRALRLISAPHGESSGWTDFHVADMVQTAGRPICTALRLLLGQSRLLALPRPQRLAALLEDSRKFQNEVSERLAEQVLHALYELLRGFQVAHDASKGELLREPLAEQPDAVYRALLTVILRLVFLLYSEERGMLPEDETFLRHYSLAGLYERLREDAALFPDTMDQRHGAWAQLLVLFRMIHDGADSGAMKLPQRHGVLFDPDRFQFLEGRMGGGARQIHERIEPPLVPDGTLYRALENLLVLDGERISYRALDVEQIGSVYETLMGFRLETATGHSVAVKSPKAHGAPSVVDLEALLEESPAQRRRWVQDRTDRKLTDRVLNVVKDAGCLEDLHAALQPVIDPHASPDLVPKGAMILQPSEERRRSGSHYTPRALTEPIVRTTLEPILARLRGGDEEVAIEEGGASPRPEQILELKICDPAMGSGAFLVEACRQLGDALIEAWRVHDALPEIPDDEDEVIFARRLIAQRCLYGVDRNTVAVDLAKMSLWLVTLAKDHALTFVDHALRHGDSLVGLSRRQIEAFHWDAKGAVLKGLGVQEPLDRVSELRRQIREATEHVSDRERRDLWDEARLELGRVRLIGDLVVSAFFEGTKAKEREAKRGAYASLAVSGKAVSVRERLDEWRQRPDKPLAPFHWELEFPEVFDRDIAGFDAFVGNPPFMGGTNISSALGAAYRDWLLQAHERSHGKGDLVAHFFRRTFDLVREGGTIGLIATNSIAEGDTRATGLRWICEHGGEIFVARKRVRWPGLAAVVVSVLHVIRGRYSGTRWLEDRPVQNITAFLFHHGGHSDPDRLRANSRKSFKGTVVYGRGFTFDDKDKKGVATPISEMQHLIEEDPRSADRIFPYIGGEEVNGSATHAHDRFVVNFGQLSLEEAGQWPALLKIVRDKVKPERDRLREDTGPGAHGKKWWWQFQHPRKSLYAAIAELDRVLVISQVTSHLQFAFLPSRMVYSHSLNVFALPGHAAFCALQSRPHEVWARFFGSSMKDDLRYTPSDCFETFPFPEDWETDPVLETAGKAYYEYRAALMVDKQEGLTKTYNRFHDPNEREPEVERLRELHATMDRVVLDAYGWDDIPTECKFLLDYEVDEEESTKRKKPWRYRWPDEVHDEVLGRFLELNAERAREELRSGAAAPKKWGRKKAAKRAPKEPQTGDLFS